MCERWGAIDTGVILLAVAANRNMLPSVKSRDRGIYTIITWLDDDKLLENGGDELKESVTAQLTVTTSGAWWPRSTKPSYKPGFHNS